MGWTVLTSQQSNLQTFSLQNLTLKFLGEGLPLIRVDTQKKKRTEEPTFMHCTFSLPSTTEETCISFGKDVILCLQMCLLPSSSSPSFDERCY